MKTPAWTLILAVAISLFQAPASGAGPPGPAPPTAVHDKTSSGRPEGVTLDELVKTALTNNSAIQGAKQAAEAKHARISPAETLPDPTISFQTMGDFLTLQAADPSSGRAYTIEQELPFPGKLGLKGKVAAAEAEAEDWNYETTRRQVISDLKVAFYDLYLIVKSMESVERSRSLLLDLAGIAESKYRVGTGSQQDIIKAQVEVSKTADRLTVLEQRHGIAEAKIRSLIYDRTGTPLDKPARFEKASLHHSREELERLALENSSKLKTQEKEIDRNLYAVQLAKKEYYPDFAVSASYVERDAMKDMSGVMVKAKIPLYFWRNQRQELKGSELSLAGAQKVRDNVVSTLSYEVGNGYILATTSQRLVELYGSTLLPQARLSVESALASYQVGSVDFLSVIDTALTLLEYEIKYYEALTDFQKALAQLEPIVGIELTR